MDSAVSSNYTHSTGFSSHSSTKENFFRKPGESRGSDKFRSTGGSDKFRSTHGSWPSGSGSAEGLDTRGTMGVVTRGGSAGFNAGGALFPDLPGATGAGDSTQGVVPGAPFPKLDPSKLGDGKSDQKDKSGDGTDSETGTAPSVFPSDPPAASRPAHDPQPGLPRSGHEKDSMLEKKIRSELQENLAGLDGIVTNCKEKSDVIGRNGEDPRLDVQYLVGIYFSNHYYMGLRHVCIIILIYICISD
jgi:hypothetical protein